MWVAVLLELACASVCPAWSRRENRDLLHSLAGGGLMSYRLCLWADGRRLDCPCLGYLRVGSAGFRSGVSVALGWFLVTTAVGSVLLIMADEWRTRHGRQPVARRRHEAKSPVHEQCGGSPSGDDRWMSEGELLGACGVMFRAFPTRNKSQRSCDIGCADCESP